MWTMRGKKMSMCYLTVTDSGGLIGRTVQRGVHRETRLWLGRRTWRTGLRSSRMPRSQGKKNIENARDLSDSRDLSVIPHDPPADRSRPPHDLPICSAIACLALSSLPNNILGAVNNTPNKECNTPLTLFHQYPKRPALGSLLLPF